MGKEFVFETREHIKPRVYALLSIACLVLLLVGYFLYVSSTDAGFSFRELVPDFDRLTPVTLFYSGIMSGLFFVPVPLEFAYIAGVRAGSPVIESTLAVIAGFVIGNLISYVAGWKLSRFALHLVSAKKLYGLRRKVNTYGGYAVFLFNVIPAPSPQLTFGLGMARYNMARLFTWLVVGNLIKFSAIGLFLSVA